MQAHAVRQSELFTKTRKEAPKDEIAKNAQLLIRAGYIHKEMAGVYSHLPLGLRVHENIKSIVREEMNAIGGQELLMSTLQNKELWERTSRWDDSVVDVWFKSSLAAGGEVGFGWSHEEPIGEMLKNHIASYKDLPVFVYQFQNKLRNELRAKSGILRGREFGMKDAYSFAADETQHEELYNKNIEAYTRIYERLGIGEDTFVTFAPGGAFTEFSHEFQTICDAGEDYIYLNREKNIAINEDVMGDDVLTKFGVTKGELERIKTAEVGNIFNFGRQKAEDLGLTFRSEGGEDTAVWMGSYGFGTTRLMGVLVEKLADEKGIVWPENVAPFAYHLLLLDAKNSEVRDEAERLFGELKNRGIEVLYDDRDTRAGEKFADADLIGIPKRIIVSERTLAEGRFEVSDRKTGASAFLGENELLDAQKRQ
ncbi:MAG: aminoacyl--tRNA ligase-related protein [bacterium]|nr:aminoacyl--tRNA ligase-related protein [bacterium]